MQITIGKSLIFILYSDKWTQTLWCHGIVNSLSQCHCPNIEKIT